MTEPLDWRALVAEAVRRRKAEGLTQKALAALAEVSAPTVIAFERGETSLRLDKALDILRVVGLAAAFDHRNDQDAFVVAARERWQALVALLPPDASARHPLGFAAYDYELVSPTLERHAPRRFIQTLREAVVRLTGWPPFWVPAREATGPTIVEGVVECWLGRPDADRVFDDPAHTDFWRALPGGRLYLQRGYQEDGPDIHEPGAIIDLTLPVRRAGEVLTHAASLARHLSPSGPGGVEVRARVLYTGLAGRELVSWANPLRRGGTPARHRARTDEVTCKVETSVEEIDTELANAVGRWLTPLYDRFDFELTDEFVAQEIDDMRSRQLGKYRRAPDR